MIDLGVGVGTVFGIVVVTVAADHLHLNRSILGTEMMMRMMMMPNFDRFGLGHRGMLLLLLMIMLIQCRRLLLLWLLLVMIRPKRVLLSIDKLDSFDVAVAIEVGRPIRWHWAAVRIEATGWARIVGPNIRVDWCLSTTVRL